MKKKFEKAHVGEGTAVLKESKNKIRVEFDRTSRWTRFKIKYLSTNFVVSAPLVFIQTWIADRRFLCYPSAVLFEDYVLFHEFK